VKRKFLDPNQRASKRDNPMLPMTDDTRFAIMLVAACGLLFAVTALSLRSLWDSRRGLFVYWDGHRMRAISPITAILRLDRLMTEERFSLHCDARLAAGGNRKALAAVGRAVTEVFELPPPDRHGLTDRQCLSLFVAFLIYLHRTERAARLYAARTQFRIAEAHR